MSDKNGRKEKIICLDNTTAIRPKEWLINFLRLGKGGKGGKREKRLTWIQTLIKIKEKSYEKSRNEEDRINVYNINMFIGGLW